jgi:hypothetical protein
MPYGIIVLIGSFALTAVYVLVTQAPVWAKAVVAALFLVALRWRYGMYVQVLLGVGISLYFTCLKARYSLGSRKF